MDSVTVSRRNRKVSLCNTFFLSSYVRPCFHQFCIVFNNLTNNINSPPDMFQTNKENDRPVFERRPVAKQPAAPFQVKASSNTKETSSKSDARYATATQKRVKTFIKDGRGAAATEKQPARQQAILREQVGKDNKITDGNPGPPATAPSKLGVYKGKVVQSKIGAIWKTSTTACSAETKQSTIKAKIPNVKNDTHSTSAASAPARRQAVPRPSQVARSAVTGRFPAHPPARPVHSKISNTAPRMHQQATFNESSKPSIVRMEKVNKPASSNLSQYRLTTETAEERRYVFSKFNYAPFLQN